MHRVTFTLLCQPLPKLMSLNQFLFLFANNPLFCICFDFEYTLCYNTHPAEDRNW